ncbi:hypothetical protein Coch_1459 [Capnocytophaga ochracea DSM 7271]|uniref:Uncharacterized protein n=1 Tax=Capnocytophaga ochracea (strain ATCC 27872 / DSM 7271 / CCUG 9716 / JCM 12966 / NCTC 12371 / SS31 / VPI 2845) TaxID=521097 RepID=C7M6D9_CAPOD|nr:hypothetical protein Coch_1459 [Capnocytophaga ochracea DSM 7271]
MLSPFLNGSPPSSFVTCHSSFLPFSVTTFPLWRGLGGGFFRFPVTTHPLIEEARYSGVCVRREVCLLFQLVPLRGFGGLPNKGLATFLPLKVASDSWVCVKGEVSSAFPPLHSPSPWEKSPNRRVCERGEDSFSFASKPRFYHFLHRCIIL